MSRASQPTASSDLVGSRTAMRAVATSVPMTTAVPRRWSGRSRRPAMSRQETPVSAAVATVSETGPVPPLNAFASARRHANAIASMIARARISAPTMRPLDRRTVLHGTKRVDRHAVRAKVRAEQRVDPAYRDDQDPVVRTPERDRGIRETLTETRRHDHERRAPREAPALAEEQRLGRAHRVRAEARQDLEASRERPRSPAERRTRTLVREVVDAIGDQADLPSGGGGEPEQLGGRRNHELDRLGIRLDPIPLVRRDVHEEDRVQARRRFIELRLELAEPRRGLPVDLLARVAAAVRTHPAEPQRIGHEAAACRGLGERTERRQRTIANGERRRIRDDLRAYREGPFRLREAQPVAGAEAEWPDAVRAARDDMQRQPDEHALTAADREPRVDPSARRARRRSRGLHALAEEEPRVEPRERHGLAVRDLDRRGHRLAGDDPIRRERDLRFDAREREAPGDRDDEPQSDRTDREDGDRGRPGHDRRQDEGRRQLPREAAGAADLARHQLALAATSSAGTGVRASTSAITVGVVRPRICASALRKRRCRRTAVAWAFTSSGST